VIGPKERQLLTSIDVIVSELLDRINALTVGSGLPPLRTFRPEDGSVLMEWIFPDFRIGFSIDPVEEDSSWYLVSNSKLGNIMRDGYLSDVDIPKLVKFAAEHHQGK
jgi:hypothetical protein